MINELTQSSIGMFNRCGHQFYLRYIKGIIIPPGIAARKGSSVHTGAEVNYRSRIENGKPAPLDVVQDATRDKYTELVNGEGVWLSDDELSEKSTLLTEGQDQAIAMAAFYHLHMAPTDQEIALIEERLYADLGVGIPVSGKPDVVADGKLIDLKTAGKRWPARKEEEQIQPTVYRMLLRENGFGELDPEYRIMTNMKRGPKETGNGVQYDPETGVCCDVRLAPRTQAHEDALKARIEAMMKAVNAGVFPPADPGGWACSPKFCGYWGACPYVKGRIISTS